MKKNMSSLDRTIRICLALVFLSFYIMQPGANTFGIVSLIIAGVLGLTSLVSFCPLYSLLGINTCRRRA